MRKLCLSPLFLSPLSVPVICPRYSPVIQGTALSKFPNIRLYELQWKLAEPSLLEFGIEIPLEKVSTPILREDAEQASVIFAMDALVLRKLSNSLDSQFPDLKHKMHLLREVAGAYEDIPDPADEKDEQSFRQVTKFIYSTVNENWKTLLSIASKEV